MTGKGETGSTFDRPGKEGSEILTASSPTPARGDEWGSEGRAGVVVGGGGGVGEERCVVSI